MSMSNANHNNWLCCCLLPFDIIADMDAAEEERADFNKLRQKINSHRVIIDSCTPGLYDLLVCPKINTTGRAWEFTEVFLWSSLDLVIPWCCLKTQIFFSRCCAKVDDLCREVCHFMLAKIGTLPSKFFEVVANTKKSDPCGDLHGKINCNWPSTRESLRLEVLDLGEKASRIILATDGDIQGQALAEELSRRLGRESLQYSTRFIPIPLNLYSVKKKRSTFYRRTSPLMQTVLMFPGAGK
ncbi:uncharacterized protein LOC142523452 isoform X2 [Primulina tabacum]|uniref:uncharacterized protein LOC142523452 isoform X2 n=1 Tax=Primulina tabacum TaxID=48773 RepID=UPI003F59ADFC